MGLELIVRPVVVRDTRPAPVQLPYVPDESETATEIAGRGGQVITLSKSENVHYDRSEGRQVETTRVVDRQRVFNATFDGSGNVLSVNRNQYVDIDQTRAVVFQNRQGQLRTQIYSAAPQADNIETIDTNIVRSAQS